MFNRDDSHLELLLARGLGRPASEVWARRTGRAGRDRRRDARRQVELGAGPRFAARLELLVAHGLGRSRGDRRRPRDGGVAGRGRLFTRLPS